MGHKSFFFAVSHKINLIDIKWNFTTTKLELDLEDLFSNKITVHYITNSIYYNFLKHNKP